MISATQSIKFSIGDTVCQHLLSFIELPDDSLSPYELFKVKYVSAGSDRDVLGQKCGSFTAVFRERVSVLTLTENSRTNNVLGH